MRSNPLQNLAAPFRRLQWKITLSYTAVTVAAILVFEILVIGGGLLTISRFFRSPLFVRGMERAVAQTLINTVRPELRKASPDDESLQADLASLSAEMLLFADEIQVPGSGAMQETQVFVVGREGSVLAAVGQRFSSTVGELYSSLPAEELPALTQAALEGGPLARRYAFAEGQLHLVLSVFDQGNEAIVGAVGVAMSVPMVDQQVIRDILPIAAASLVIFSLGTGLIGALFGFLTSRPLVRRLSHLSNVTGDWSHGDFTVFVQDEGGDELAALARRMNRMAEQLQNLLVERNRYAVSQERNRIARDLHDSVKQEAFAAAGQIGAARALLTRDPTAAEGHLREAEELIYTLRQGLTLLIEELRPAELEGKGLGPALKAYAERWSRRTGIVSLVTVRGKAHLPLKMEETFFRIAQEVLANAARHSEATRVELSLTYQERDVELKVSDDGVGFDPQGINPGFGLSSIRQRAASLPEGTFALHTGPGEGTAIEVRARIWEEATGERR